jgi:TolB-like protein
MADVFVSYARSTEATARVVAERLRGLGYEVWLDDQLPAHRAYADVIEERLRAASSVVVVWSADAAKSQWVRSEAEMARGSDKLVQLTVDRARLPMPFDQIQCADLSKWTGDADAIGWRQVVEGVAALRDGAPGVGVAEAQPQDQARHPRRAAPAERVLAVLAFENLSGDADMAYFSDGVSEEILLAVAGGVDVKVIARSSSFQFRGADKAVGNVASRLNTTHVLDGSVRRSGNRVRIFAQLIECARETSLWSERFDRDLSDIFALQDEIATAVAGALKLVFAPVRPAEPVDPAAYDMFLRARALLLDGHPDREGRNTRAKSILEGVVAAAPGFANAWALLAAARSDLAYLVVKFRGSAATGEAAVHRAAAVEAAGAALELDPTQGGVYSTLSSLEPQAHYQEQEALLDKALAVSPNDPDVLMAVSGFRYRVGMVGEACRLAKLALALNPLYWPAAHWQAAMLMQNDEWDAGRLIYDELLARWPEVSPIWLDACWHAALSGDAVRLESLVASVKEQGFYTLEFRGHINALRNLHGARPGFLDGALQRAEDELARTGSVTVNSVYALHWHGLCDEAFGLMERSSYQHLYSPDAPRAFSTGENAGAIFGRHLLKFQSDIRFIDLCEKLGLCDYWVKTDLWPDCADAGVTPYDFKAECRHRVNARAKRPPAETNA